MSANYDEFPDLEVLALRKKVQELELKLEQAQAVLREHDLLDAKSAPVSDVEELCIRELKLFNELSKKGVGLTLEDNKNIDILHKNLLLARGKAPADEGKKKKKEEKPDLAKLLKFVEETK